MALLYTYLCRYLRSGSLFHPIALSLTDSKQRTHAAIAPISTGQTSDRMGIGGERSVFVGMGDSLRDGKAELAWQSDGRSLHGSFEAATLPFLNFANHLTQELAQEPQCHLRIGQNL
ncbi:MAG: hypothetical protein HC833_01555 [Leptolyngbyaceae cyanobacterium RM1_406_9]|nr:hypothetical protein [Leptolyngbyaceae cyanobacterium RM1_406_9]